MNDRVARCLLIAKVLVADGIMTADERSLLTNAMNMLDLDDAEREQVKNLEGLDQAEPIVAGLPLEKKQEVIDFLIEAALADGALSKHETEAVKKISEALGFE
jgi:uncharacterized tellurite resistance protein B-like protein